jgi:hypothetical protein
LLHLTPNFEFSQKNFHLFSSKISMFFGETRDFYNKFKRDFPASSYSIFWKAFHHSRTNFMFGEGDSCSNKKIEFFKLIRNASRIPNRLRDLNPVIYRRSKKNLAVFNVKSLVHKFPWCLNWTIEDFKKVS